MVEGVGVWSLKKDSFFSLLRLLIKDERAGFICSVPHVSCVVDRTMKKVIRERICGIFHAMVLVGETSGKQGLLCTAIGKAAISWR